MKSRSHTKDHGHQSGSETSAQANAVRRHGLFPVAVGKAYEHYVGKALAFLSYSKNSLLTALVNCKAMMVGCQYVSFLCLQLASRHDQLNHEIAFTEFGTGGQFALHQVLAGYIT